MKEPLLKVSKLKKYFYPESGQVLKAVDGVDLSVNQGETMGLVGESGCGKSTLGRTICGLYRPDLGSVEFRGRDLLALKRKEKLWRARQIQMIFQDPYASLNPRMTVNDIIGEALDIHSLARRMDRAEKINNYLVMVGLDADHASRYPHEFSGGQRQRIGIARALAVDPSLIICDEPISALDVSIQAQIVNLLERLQEDLGLTYLFIAHDLSMVRYISKRVAVMYMGKIVEEAKCEELYGNAMHPYTRALLSAIPIPDPRVERSRQRVILEGEATGEHKTHQGCRFSGRCPQKKDICFKEEPVLERRGSDHRVACHFA